MIDGLPVLLAALPVLPLEGWLSRVLSATKGATADFSKGGSVVDVHRLLAHLPLDDLLILKHVLAHSYLLLNHGALRDDLLFGRRHKNLYSPISASGASRPSTGSRLTRTSSRLLGA